MSAPTRLPVFDVHLLPPPDPAPEPETAPRAPHPRWWVGAAAALYLAQVAVILGWVSGL